MDYEPLTNTEQKIVDEVDKMFGDKDVTLKSIVLYTRLSELYPNDDEIKDKILKLKNKMKKIHLALTNNVSNELKCTLDDHGNIVVM